MTSIYIDSPLTSIAVDSGAAGATPVTRLTELAWGDRVGRVRDPLGNIWWIQERLEEPAPDELARRFQDPKFTEAMRYVQSTLGPGLNAT
jgi:PhnB protein